MKTAISVPDDVFREGETYARKTRRTRSQLYTEALSEYLTRHSPEQVTSAMDAVVAALGDDQGDEFIYSASRSVLERSEW